MHPSGNKNAALFGSVLRVRLMIFEAVEFFSVGCAAALFGNRRQMLSTSPAFLASPDKKLK